MSTPAEYEFKCWLRQMDEFVWQTVGCSIDDLPDVCLHDWFDDGMKPKTAAVRAIRNADIM